MRPRMTQISLHIREVWSEYIFVRMKKLCIVCYPKCAQWRFWPDCTNAQAELNPHQAYMSEGDFPTLRLTTCEVMFRYLRRSTLNGRQFSVSYPCSKVCFCFIFIFIRSVHLAVFVFVCHLDKKKDDLFFFFFLFFFLCFFVILFLFIFFVCINRWKIEGL